MTLEEQHGRGLMWGAYLWVMDSRTPGETEYCIKPDIIKLTQLSLFINSQYRSLMSVNKPPPGKNRKVHLGFIILTQSQAHTSPQAG